MPGLRRLLAVLYLPLMLAACGGPLKPDELQRRVESLESTAASGRLLAEGVASDSTKATFVRAQARDLGETAIHEAEKVSDSVGLDPQREQTVSLAASIADAIEELQIDPGDVEAARGVAEELSRLEDEAKQIRSRL